MAVGGKGLNQAVAAARFGAGTRMAGAIGDDAEGAMLRAALVAEGVDVSALDVLADVPSGRATILIEPAGENMIAVVPGANLRARPEAAWQAIDAETRVLLAQNEVDIAEMERLFASDRAAGLTRILNAAPAVPEAARLFPLVDVLIVNQSECADFLGLDSEPQGVEDLDVVRRLLTRAGQSVVVTLGAGGSALVTHEDIVFAPAFAAPEVVDTSGAGDCFCGVLAACIDLGIGMEAALRYANAAASLSVGCKGAAPSMPIRADVDALVG
ncbi:ribokinase [Novosphingobium sp. 9]|uniref:ribokinase n=1 Tax=Novosphingobium sp. 9 TaxID=2025349 RepID=UPI0021B5998E|nr:ribokinase [Novosphingobium sp. 9]